jgi:tricorn protease
MKRLMALLILLFLLNTCLAKEQARLLRFPAIHEDQIVFTYAGDLYTVPTEGGTARKLTNHEGFEMFPQFSSDGKWIAFTGQYDGNTEVYLMPAEGGEPKRLTFTATLGRDDVSDRMGPNNIVMTWKNKKNEIIFRSRMHSFNSFQGQLYTVNLKGELPQELPLPRGGFCSFSPDDKKLVYNRVFREFRTWKRYRGGMADDVWIYDFQTKKTENITDNPAQDIIPMWHGSKIYFLSDRDKNKRMNLFVYDLKTKKTRQLTDFTDFDIKFPSLGKRAIVFENGGFIYRYDLAAGKERQIPIYLQEDRSPARGGLLEVADKVTNFEIAPDGKRALFGARGDVFTIPAKHGAVRNLMKTPGVHERNSKWSPDGKWIAYISDLTGEDEIYIIPQDGSGDAKQITKNAETYKYDIRWSPDSKKILWGDKRLRLRYVEIDSRKITEVDKSESWEFRQYAWSHDSRWIVYVRSEKESMDKVYLHSLETKKSHPITKGWYDVGSPTFSSDGKYVFFVSNRDFNPIYSRTEWNHAYQDMSRIYLITLAKDTESPFKPISDEVEIKDEEKKESEPDKIQEEKKKKKKKGKKQPLTKKERRQRRKAARQKKQQEEKEKAESVKKDVKKEDQLSVDIDGIQERIAVLPTKTSSYFNLASVGETLYYNRRGSKDDKTRLFIYNLKDKKETEVGAINGYEISADRKKMLVKTSGKYAIIDLPKGKADPKEFLNLSGMEVFLNRKLEWEQIFTECWRQMREFFYVENMHGVDWPAMRKRYEPLVEHVNHRADLTYVIGEMIGELNVGHTYVGGGDAPKPKRIDLGLLGAQVTRDVESGYYRINTLLRGQNWDKSLRSPLTEIGVNADEGDYILAVNGESTKEVVNIYKLLINKASKQITLKLNAEPKEENSRDVIVIPTASEEQLYYYGWVQSNIEKVAEATDGKVGYLHVPDMGQHGLNEFVKYFYPQIRKKALIIDVRGNGGGNVSPMLIERLRREITMVEFSRDTAPRTEPSAMIYGPMVCLCDEYSASDGDLFTYQFKKHQIGKVIGKRTWGGVVGIRGSLPLLDGGYLRKPEFSRYDIEGKKWIIEGIGVEPDIFVDNDPAQEYAGADQQLNKAIDVILEELKQNEKEVPPLPPLPVR